jgi:hypothetical protein
MKRSGSKDPHQRIRMKDPDERIRMKKSASKDLHGMMLIEAFRRKRSSQEL